MAKNGFPWWRKDKGSWYVWHAGKQVRLGPDKETALGLWHRLAVGQEGQAPATGHDSAPTTPAGPTVAEVVDAYLAEAATRLKPGTMPSKRKVLGRLKQNLGDR